MEGGGSFGPIPAGRMFKNLHSRAGEHAFEQIVIDIPASLRTVMQFAFMGGQNSFHRIEF